MGLKMALNIVGQIDPEGGDKSIVNEKYDSKSRTKSQKLLKLHYQNRYSKCL